MREGLAGRTVGMTKGPSEEDDWKTLHRPRPVGKWGKGRSG